MAVLHLVVLAAVLGWGGERRGDPHCQRAQGTWPVGQSTGQGQGSQLGTCTTWGQSVPSTGSVCPSVKWGEAGLLAMGEGRVGARLTLMNCMSSLVFFSMCCRVSMEGLHLCGVQGGVDQGDPIIPRPRCSTDHSAPDTPGSCEPSEKWV